jgi:hypothetical protein
MELYKGAELPSWQEAKVIKNNSIFEVGLKDNTRTWGL